MKQDQHTTLAGSKTTSADVCRWVQSLFSLHTRIAPRFARASAAPPGAGLSTRDRCRETERKEGMRPRAHHPA